ncbi:MAG: hypothetical protein ACLP7A_11530 [Desulfobaccales bacterium]
MAKNADQIYAERRQRIEERREFLREDPERYQRDFDEAFKNYLMRKYPEEDLDPEDCDNRFHPLFRRNFPESPEGRELAIKYSLQDAWDPDGNDSPSPVVLSSVRVIRCQDNRIWPYQIQKDSIINLAPKKLFGRFLILEIELSYPPSEIKTDIMAWVDNYWRDLEISGPHRALVRRPKPRNRASSYKFEQKVVWRMVEEERQNQNEGESEILWRIAKSSITDSTDEKKCRREERKIYNALINAYQRDKELYYGEPIFRDISE